MIEPPILAPLQMVRMGGRWHTELATPMSVVRAATATSAFGDEPEGLTLEQWLNARFGTSWTVDTVSDGKLILRLIEPLDICEIEEFYVDPLFFLT